MNALRELIIEADEMSPCLYDDNTTTIAQRGIRALILRASRFVLSRLAFSVAARYRERRQIARVIDKKNEK